MSEIVKAPNVHVYGNQRLVLPSYLDMDDESRRKHRLREACLTALKIRRKGTPEHPLIAKNSGNVFHHQACAQLASAYESLQLGDSRRAVEEVYQLGQRIFGRELFDRAVREHRLNGSTA